LAWPTASEVTQCPDKEAVPDLNRDGHRTLQDAAESWHGEQAAQLDESASRNPRLVLHKIRETHFHFVALVAGPVPRRDGLDGFCKVMSRQYKERSAIEMIPLVCQIVDGAE